MKVNCAAIPAEPLESELFGYRKGAFTGGVRDYAGKFLAADGGTLFLDEIGDREPRLLAATNKTLKQMVAGGRFREGLYHRLNGVQIFLAPLRERRMDIAPSAEYFLNQ